MRADDDRVQALYYLRVGFEKEAKYAGADWADGARHLGSLQDPEARMYNKKNDSSTHRALRGGRAL